MTARGIALIACAVVLSAAVLGVQLASGGGDFVPQRPADPCQPRTPTAPTDLEGLAEVVVLTGLDEAACRLGVSRERLVLALPAASDRAALARELGTDERGLATAIHDGLHAGIGRLDKAGVLPKPSTLLPWIADEIGIRRDLVDLIPDRLVDSLPSTATMLRWAVDRIDVSQVLAGLDAGRPLESVLRDALVDGIKDEGKRILDSALPGPLKGLFG